jgi:hypothetical protein
MAAASTATSSFVRVSTVIGYSKCVLTDKRLFAGFQ